MKKVLSSVLALAMVFAMALSFTSCNNGKIDSIEAFVATDEMQSQIKEAKESVEDGTLTMDIVAEGNKLVYVYTYQTDLDIEATKEALATAIEQQASVFENVAKEIKNAVNVENPIVEVRYLAKDGTEIYSQELVFSMRTTTYIYLFLSL